MEISVTGGTGFVGREVVRQLLAAHHRVRLLVRRPGGPRTSPAAGDSPAVRVVDLADPDQVAAAINGSDAVVHLVGIISEAGTQTFEHVHTALTRSVVTGAVRARVPRILQMSALGTRPGARSRYHRTKWEAEEVVRASGLRWTIFRPSLIHGSEDSFTNLFDRMARWSPFLPVLGGGRNRLQPIAVSEVARAFVGALGLEASIGQVFDLCGPERPALVDVLRAILEARGRKRLLVPIPWWLAGLQARFLEVVFPLFLRRAPPLNRDQILMLQEDNVGNGAVADRLFGLRHPSLSSALRERWRPGEERAP